MSDGGGALSTSTRVSDGDWACMVKCGQNGVLMFLAALAWWGKAVMEEGNYVDAEWENALEDFESALVGLLRH